MTLYSLCNNVYLDMPSGYDEFTDRAHPNFTGASITQANNRDLLIEIMQKNDFVVDTNEWWHFDYIDWASYPLVDVSFADILASEKK
jgi:zinc D-Ala-D-Ala dipeptidase